MRPCWAEISLSQLSENYRFLRELAGEKAELLAIVKADAYGHGLGICAPELAKQGARWMGITSVEEGVALREVCPQQRILIVSGIWKGQAEEAIRHRLTPVVWEQFHLDELEQAAKAIGLGPQSFPVHIELDTGMSRQGVALDGDALERFLSRFNSQSPLLLEGVMTHFSSADVLKGKATTEQTILLRTALQRIKQSGAKPTLLHAGATATIISGEDLDVLAELAASMECGLMLRPGLALYGYLPRFLPGNPPALAKMEKSCRPILSWKTRVVSLRTIPAGQSAGYNETFVAARPTKIALLPLGYADGLNRLLSNRFDLLVRGHRAPIAGRISMDHTMLDVTDIPGVEIGDEVTVLGTQGEQVLTAYDHADAAGTIPWEILCDIAARVPRLAV